MKQRTFAAIVAVVATLSQTAHAQGACVNYERIFVEAGDRQTQNWANILVDNLRLQGAAKAVIESGVCSCENWRPSWDAAVAQFNAEFAGLNTKAMSDALRENQAITSPLAAEARAICRAQGGPR